MHQLAFYCTTSQRDYMMAEEILSRRTIEDLCFGNDCQFILRLRGDIPEAIFHIHDKNGNNVIGLSIENFDLGENSSTREILDTIIEQVYVNVD